MTFPQMIFLFIAAALGGTLNSVAGGGTFITLPVLIFTGVPPVQANTTSTVALWPAAIASTGAYRKELAVQRWSFLALMIGTSLIGGYLGARLLLGTSQSTFVLLLPYLMLLATLLFTFSPMITQRLRSLRSAENSDKARTGWLTLVGMAVAQLVIAIYGGYFGGGIGILMLATLAIMGMENIHEMNAVKTLLNACINAVAVVAFIANGAVLWPQAILMLVGSIAGGYGGAYYARKIEQKWIRLFVMMVGFAMTIYFFVKAFWL